MGNCTQREYRKHTFAATENEETRWRVASEKNTFGKTIGNNIAWHSDGIIYLERMERCEL